ncbi:hypothetical protein CEXT_474071 [Caerostris extrusa]|uniref:Uncharacterized protein n=1 Tax=Caerostris extrusa TaxID=172846 RepID=A0AAV4T5E3_CAEEX|nr:hypothetical protein CEXT_474071 [Caerostris extrusa]
MVAIIALGTPNSHYSCQARRVQLVRIENVCNHASLTTGKECPQPRCGRSSASRHTERYLFTYEKALGCWKAGLQLKLRWHLVLGVSSRKRKYSLHLSDAASPVLTPVPEPGARQQPSH